MYLENNEKHLYVREDMYLEIMRINHHNILGNYQNYLYLTLSFLKCRK